MALPPPPGPAAVLIVEDHPDIREGLAMLLHNRGYSVATAANGEEGLQRLRTGPRPRVILLDLMMPKLDGFGFRREQLKISEWAGIPVIVVSGTYDAKLQAVALGATGSLQKPVDVDHLFALMRQHCQ